MSLLLWSVDIQSLQSPKYPWCFLQNESFVCLLSDLDCSDTCNLSCILRKCNAFYTFYGHDGNNKTKENEVRTTPQELWNDWSIWKRTRNIMHISPQTTNKQPFDEKAFLIQQKPKKQMRMAWMTTNGDAILIFIVYHVHFSQTNDGYCALNNTKVFVYISSIGHTLVGILAAYFVDRFGTVHMDLATDKPQWEWPSYHHTNYNVPVHLITFRSMYKNSINQRFWNEYFANMVVCFCSHFIHIVFCFCRNIFPAFVRIMRGPDTIEKPYKTIQFAEHHISDFFCCLPDTVWINIVGIFGLQSMFFHDPVYHLFQNGHSVAGRCLCINNCLSQCNCFFLIQSLST